MLGQGRAAVAGGTESMSMVPMGGNKVSPNPALVVELSGRLPQHRPGRREPRARVEHLARGAGRVRAAQPSARDRGDRRGPFQERDRAAHRAGRSQPNGAQAHGEGTHLRHRRRPAPRHVARSARRSCSPAFHVSGTVTAGNSSQTSDGAAAVIVTSAELRQGARPDAAGALRRLRHRRRRAGAVRHRPGAGDQEGAEAGRADARSDRPDRAERGVRRAGAGLHEGAPISIRTRSTSTAARSRSAIRSAAPARS